MILRRLSQSLKEQNWTAIVIEFILLIVGVFVGIQMANWNEERNDRKSEKDYLLRLQQEIVEILPQAKADHGFLVDDMALIEQLRAYLATGQGGNVLDARHCVSAGRSHIYASTIYYPPTIKELISTGRILLIRDPVIKTAIVSFDQSHNAITQLRTDIQIDRQVLARHHPALINSGLSINWTGTVCDFEGMRKDQAFLNDFTDNIRRYRAFTNEYENRQVKGLEALVAALASEKPGKSLQTPAKTSKASSSIEKRVDQ
jgi:hypothetical protein